MIVARDIVITPFIVYLLGEIFDEIASRWERSSQNDEHLSLEKRSFLNHIFYVNTATGEKSGEMLALAKFEAEED